MEKVTVHVEERVENFKRCRKPLGEAQQKLNAVEWEKPQIIDKVARVTKSAIQEGMADALMVAQRQVPLIMRFQKIVEMSQVQFIDKDDDFLPQDFGQPSFH